MMSLSVGLKTESLCVPMKPEHTETILVVDDEDIIRETVQVPLERIGYKVFTAGNGEEAVRIGREFRGEIHLLLVDVTMSGLNGKALAEQLVAWRPTMKVIFMSPHSQCALTQQGLLLSESACIQKPFSLGLVLDKVLEILDKPQT